MNWKYDRNQSPSISVELLCFDLFKYSFTPIDELKEYHFSMSKGGLLDSFCGLMKLC